MVRYAVDASAVLALLIEEAHTPAAKTFIESLTASDELVAPAFLLVECTSNIRELVFEGMLSAEEATAKLEQALRLPIRPVLNAEQHRIAIRLSGQRRTRKAYDAHYLAVAALEGAEIVTIDGGMYKGALNLQIPARLIR